MCDSGAIRTTFSSKKIITKNLENSNSNILDVYWAPNLNTVHLVKSSNLCLSWEFFIFRIPSSTSSSLWSTTYIFPFYFVLLGSCCRRWLRQWSKFPGSGSIFWPCCWNWHKFSSNCQCYKKYAEKLQFELCGKLKNSLFFDNWFFCYAKSFENDIFPV